MEPSLRSLKVRQSRVVSGHHTVEVSGPVMPHTVQALTKLAASNTTNFSVALQTLEETVSFSMYQGADNEVSSRFEVPSQYLIFSLRAPHLCSPRPVWTTVDWSLTY